MKEQHINVSREELEKIWCKNNANVPRMESEYPATPEEAIILNGKDVMKALKQYEVPTGSIKIWNLPEGYEFRDENDNVINATKIVLEKKKKEYPKTYEECCEILQYNKYLKVYPPFNSDIPNYDALQLFDLLETLRKLRICRDAYWKIASDETGKPWKPDLLNDTQDKFVLANWDYNIEKHDYRTNRNYILTFPTEEMRDAFYENFKELIETVKELL